jgi:hypothetical protein
MTRPGESLRAAQRGFANEGRNRPEQSRACMEHNKTALPVTSRLTAEGSPREDATQTFGTSP